MNASNFKLALLALMLISAVTQNCQSNPTTDRIATGSYTFALNPFSSRTNCYNISLANVFAPGSAQVTTGVSQIGQFQNSNSGIDFSLRSFLTGAGQASFTLIVNNGSWNTVKISYLVTARTDFYVGTHLSDANQLATCTKQNPFALTILVPSTASVPLSQALAVLVFLNGLRTPSTGFAFQFTQPIYDATLKQINLTVVSTATS